MIYVAVSLLVCALLIAFLVHVRTRASSAELPVHVRLERFNINALRNLLSAEEQLFLQSHVKSARTYRTLHRERMRLALRCLGRLSEILREVPARDDVRVLNSEISRLRLMAIASYCFPSVAVSCGEFVDLAFSVQATCTAAAQMTRKRQTVVE